MSIQINIYGGKNNDSRNALKALREIISAQ